VTAPYTPHPSLPGPRQQRDFDLVSGNLWGPLFEALLRAFSSSLFRLRVKPPSSIHTVIHIVSHLAHCRLMLSLLPSSYS
jgi:hypothetical protein